MQFWNENLKKLKPYTPGEQNKKLIKLNTNENPFPPSPNIYKTINQISNKELTLYPDPLTTTLKTNIAKIYNTNIKNVFCGNGSDEILNLIIRAFINTQKDKILIPYPNYFLYETLAQSYGAKYQYSHSDQNFNTNFEKLLNIPSKLIFISNPNSPTGKLIPIKHIYQFCKEYKGLTIIDEAYIDFANNNNSSIKLINKLNNIIVIRTLSKSFALAGIRLGYAFAHENIINGLNKIKDSYNINSLSQIIANQAIMDYNYMQNITRKIIENRTLLYKKLKNMNFSIIKSNANFLFCSHEQYHAKTIFNTLKENHILVRYFDKPLINNYIRITIGTKKQINILSKCLKTIIKK